MTTVSDGHPQLVFIKLTFVDVSQRSVPTSARPTARYDVKRTQSPFLRTVATGTKNSNKQTMAHHTPVGGSGNAKQTKESRP